MGRTSFDHWGLVITIGLYSDIRTPGNQFVASVFDAREKEVTDQIEE